MEALNSTTIDCQMLAILICDVHVSGRCAAHILTDHLPTICVVALLFFLSYTITRFRVPTKRYSHSFSSFHTHHDVATFGPRGGGDGFERLSYLLCVHAEMLESVLARSWANVYLGRSKL